MFKVVLHTPFGHICIYSITDRRHNPCRYTIAQNFIEMKDKIFTLQKGADASLYHEVSLSNIEGIYIILVEIRLILGS